MGSINLENFPTSKSAQKMLEYVSTGFYEKSYVGKWIYQVMGLEYDDALQLAESLPKQFFLETATWGLRYHEEKWQLPVRENLSYEERRRLIYMRRDYRTPMTPYRMETILRNATGLDICISDCHDPGSFRFITSHPNIFRVDFNGGSTLDVIKALRLLDQIKQSHTTYTICHRLESGTARILVTAITGLSNTIKVKAKTADKIETKETLHIMTAGAVGTTLKVKPLLAKQIQLHAIQKAEAGILEGNILKVKARIPEQLTVKVPEKIAVCQKIGNSLKVKGEK